MLVSSYLSAVIERYGGNRIAGKMWREYVFDRKHVTGRGQGDTTPRNSALGIELTCVPAVSSWRRAVVWLIFSCSCFRISVIKLEWHERRYTLTVWLPYPGTIKLTTPRLRPTGPKIVGAPPYNYDHGLQDVARPI